MIITNTQNRKQINNPTFKGPLDGAITQSLIAIDTNPMINAALVDVFSMVIPRTYVDTKERNKYAGGETLFRELTGTFIVCLSSGFFAKGIANLYNKFVNPETKINPKSWVSNDGLNLLHHAWNKSGNKTEQYVSNVLSNMSGVDGKETSEWKNINWNNIEWTENSKINKFEWKNSKFNNIQNKLKDKDQIIKALSEIINDKNIDKKDEKQIIEIIENRITNALKVTNSVDVKLDDKVFGSSLTNILRDTLDLGKNIFTNHSVNTEAAIEKLTKMNKVKTLGSLAIASSLGLTNQYINRKITEKRTGTDAFVGDVDYKNFVGKRDESKKENKGKFLALKLLASAGIIALAAGVMKIKTPKDFIKKLEFTGPVTSGNAIKTVYTATLVGRFLASKNETELRESATRDYLGFLNWLVLGSFVAKGVGNLLDTNRSKLFNMSEAPKEEKGIKNVLNKVNYWLNGISLKSHAEIMAKGEEFASKNVWKLNAAKISGLAYSTIALGFLLPKLNIAITKNKHNKEKIAELKSNNELQINEKGNGGNNENAINSKLQFTKQG